MYLIWREIPIPFRRTLPDCRCRLSELMSKEPGKGDKKRTMVGNGGNARNY